MKHRHPRTCKIAGMVHSYFIPFEFAGRGGTVKPQLGRGVLRFPPKLQIEQITAVEVLSDRLIELAPHQSRER